MKINNDNDHEKAMTIVDFLFDSLDLPPNDFYNVVGMKMNALFEEIEKYEQERWPL